MRRILVGLINIYQYLLSPLKPTTCRFTPTCSCYACEVIIKHGAWYGTWLSVKRLIRCNPWNSGGYDPAP